MLPILFRYIGERTSATVGPAVGMVDEEDFGDAMEIVRCFHRTQDRLFLFYGVGRDETPSGARERDKIPGLDPDVLPAQILRQIRPIRAVQPRVHAGDHQRVDGGAHDVQRITARTLRMTRKATSHSLLSKGATRNSVMSLVPELPRNAKASKLALDGGCCGSKCHLIGNHRALEFAGAPAGFFRGCLGNLLGALRHVRENDDRRTLAYRQDTSRHREQLHVIATTEPELAGGNRRDERNVVRENTDLAERRGYTHDVDFLLEEYTRGSDKFDGERHGAMQNSKRKR